MVIDQADDVALVLERHAHLHPEAGSWRHTDRRTSGRDMTYESATSGSS
jgi:hypothetical protein